MNLVNFLVEVLKISGLLFLICVLFNLFIEVLILRPIQNRAMNKQQKELFDIVIEQLKNGELTIDDIEKFRRNFEDEEIEK